MATLTPSSTKGQTQFEAASPWRNRSDEADSMVGGTYSHKNIEFSATEADEWASWMLFVTSLLKSGVSSFPIRNNTGGTLTRGTLVRVTGYDSGNGKFTVTKGASNTAGAADLVLAADLANNTNGIAYKAITVTGTSGEPLNTSAASAVGALVYLDSTAGAFTFTAPTRVDYASQLIGVVLVKDATVGSIAFFPGARIILAAREQDTQGTVVSPSSIGANQTDYSPAGLSGAAVLRLTSSGAYNIVSLDPTARSVGVLVVHNIGSNTLTFKKDDGATGTAGWRFDIAEDFPLTALAVAILQYDTTSSRWRIIGGSGAASGGGRGIYGTGVDGSGTMDGSATVFGLAPTSNVYTATGDIYADTLTINASKTLNMAGYRLFCKTALVNNGTIKNNGSDGSGTSGGNGAASGTLPGGKNGGAGATAGTATAGTGASSAVGASGGTGGNGGVNGGAAGGTATAPTAALGGVNVVSALPQAALFRAVDASALNGGCGGGGGGKGSGGQGGGGAGGGGCLFVAARSLTGSGTITAAGGVGADGPATDGGGGGGGGGGCVVTISDNDVAATSLTISAPGGNGGNGNGGSGLPGDPGSDGNVFKIRN